MNEEILEIIRDVLYAQQGTLTEQTELDDVIQDSMEVIELIAVLSNTYNLSVQPEQMNEITTVGELVAFVEKNKNTQQAEGLDRF